MDNSLEAVEKWTRVNLKGMSWHSEWEDAIQEAILHAWKDMESGQYTFLHVVHRAGVWARAFLQKGKRATGSPSLSRDGIGTAASDAQMWKIVQYRQEYFELHEHFPRNADVATVFDIASSCVDRHINRHKEGRYDHAIYVDKPDGSRELHPSYRTPVHIEAMGTTPDGETVDATATFSQFAEPSGSAEDRVLEDIDFYALLRKLLPVHQKTLYLVCVMGCNTTQVAEHFGYTKDKNQNGYKKITYAKEAARKILEKEGVLDATGK